MCYSSELKSHEMLFVHNLLLSVLIILKFCTVHGSATAMPCAKFQNDWATRNGCYGQTRFMRFEFKMSFE